MPNSRLVAILERDAQLAKIRKERHTQLKENGSLAEAQIAFIKELTKDAAEAKQFHKDPEQYAKEHNIQFTPDVLEMVLDATLFDIEFTDPVKERLGVHALKDLVDMKETVIIKGSEPHAIASEFTELLYYVEQAVKSFAGKPVNDRPVTIVSGPAKGTNVKDIILPNGVRFIERDFKR